MKQALIIGSTVADVTVRLPHLPVTGEDVIVESQSISLGGCACNASEILRQSGVLHTLLSPVRTGIYGSYAREHLKRKQIPILIPALAADNGCCYCFVEESGERTSATPHGTEYRFERQWFSLTEPLSVGSVYVCGLELEEDTGGFILDYLEEYPEYTAYFALGPRISFIPQSSLRRMFSLSPILHLNRDEALEYTGTIGSPENKKPRKEADPLCQGYRLEACLPEVVSRLTTLTHNHVITILGAHGAFHMEPSGKHALIPGCPAWQVDVAGAGDSHMGIVIACRTRGFPMDEVIRTANRIFAAVVEYVGAGLDDEDFLHLNA